MPVTPSRVWSALILAAGFGVAGVLANQAEAPKPAPKTETPAAESPKSESPSTGPKAEFPADWFYRGNQPALLGKPAPAITVANWTNGEAMKLEDLKGKIVVLDFWGVWCPPCRAAIPHTNEMHKKYADKGVQIIGIHSRRMADKMADAVTKLKMEYPTAADTTGASERDYSVAFWPFYVIIDREGVVRAAGLNPEYLGNALEALLKEQPPKAS